MFSHVMVGVNDIDASRRFYDAVLGTLGIKPGIHNHNGVVDRYFYRTPTGSFGITQPLNGQPATAANGAGSNIQFGAGGMALSTGFAAAVTGGIAVADTTAVAAATFAINCDYE